MGYEDTDPEVINKVYNSIQNILFHLYMILLYIKINKKEKEMITKP